MAALSPAPAFAPTSSSSESSSSSSVVLPSTQSATTSTYPTEDMMCDNHNVRLRSASWGADNDGPMIDDTTQGALDALAALVSSSNAISSSAESHSSSLLIQSQQITPHQTSSDDDSEIMPPPPPRNPTNMMPSSTYCDTASSPSTAYPSFTFLHESTPLHNMGSSSANNGGGRVRSASNPEGMEKWDLYSQRNDRQHFVLPSSILEEELASTRRALGEIADDEDDDGLGHESVGGMQGFHTAQPSQPQQSTAASQNSSLQESQQHWSSMGLRRSERTIARLGTSPDSVTDLSQGNPLTATTKPKSSNAKSTNANPSPKSRKKQKPTEIIPTSPPLTTDEEDEDEVDESSLEPEELLRRARSRLLEDLSESNCDSTGEPGLNGDKGSILILPHSLSKYKEVYNKNGRIGIYTPAERAAIIQKFNAKRARRMWKKKIRYNCRKNLADRRMRVKGRFVKRSVEAANSPPPPSASAEDSALAAEDSKGVQFKMDEDTIDDNASIQVKKETCRSSSPPTSGSPLTTVSEEQQQQQSQSSVEDAEMPDVNDDDAGFEPSDDMPYRRTRRYTIT